MNYIVYIIRFLFRIKWWLILLPITVALMVYVKMGTMARMYKTQTTIYTGVVSGYDIETNANSRQDWNVINNAIDNLINIIKSQTTLRNVSMRLFAQHLMHGDPNKDNIYITAANYRRLLENTPKEVLALVDRTSDSVTLARLFAYEKADHDNYVYGLFHWTHRHYSYDVLNTIEVKRLSNSDMLEVSYQNDDPGIVYNTLVLLNDEFRNQYHDLRFGET
ncbi:MAG: exopolysaccharide biosynthesis protein, partial [Alistipes sp.]